jgi:Acyl carrier protein
MNENDINGIEAKVIKIVGECAGTAGRADDASVTESAEGAISVALSSDLREDLNFDSLDLMMLASELEAAFGAALSDEDLKAIATVGDIVAKIKEAARNA